MRPKALISEKTLRKIAESPEEFARLFLESYGTDALEDFINRLNDIFYKEGSHK